MFPASRLLVGKSSGCLGGLPVACGVTSWRVWRWSCTAATQASCYRSGGAVFSLWVWSLWCMGSCKRPASPISTAANSWSPKLRPCARCFRLRPRVVLAPHIRKILVRIDFDLHELLGKRPHVGEVVAFEPRLDGKSRVLDAAVAERQTEVRRHRQPARTREKDRGERGAGRVGSRAHRIHGLVHNVGAQEPAAPKVREILAHAVFHRAEDVDRR